MDCTFMPKKTLKVIKSTTVKQLNQQLNRCLKCTFCFTKEITKNHYSIIFEEGEAAFQTWHLLLWHHVFCVPDINECSELNKKMSLCKNGKCINTQGSYKCVCLPGFVHSAQHNYCVPQRQNATSTSTEWPAGGARYNKNTLI